MTEEKHLRPWDQQPGEKLLWYRRFMIYLQLPNPRRITDAVRQEQNNPHAPMPSKQWYAAFKQWHWEERAAAYDAFQDEQEESLLAAEKAQIIKKQYALMHKRVEALNSLALRLEKYMEDETKIWLQDVKFGSGPGAERVDLIKFNDGLISEYRSTFADLAAELGHRIKKTKMDVSVLPKEYIGIDEDEEGSEA